MCIRDRVYVVREPQGDDDRVRAIERYVAVYPDGPHNAEAPVSYTHLTLPTSDLV